MLFKGPTQKLRLKVRISQYLLLQSGQLFCFIFWESVKPKKLERAHFILFPLHLSCSQPVFHQNFPSNSATTSPAVLPPPSAQQQVTAWTTSETQDGRRQKWRGCCVCLHRECLCSRQKCVSSFALSWSPEGFPTPDPPEKTSKAIAGAC